MNLVSVAQDERSVVTKKMAPIDYCLDVSQNKFCECIAKNEISKVLIGQRALRACTEKKSVPEQSALQTPRSDLEALVQNHTIGFLDPHLRCLSFFFDVIGRVFRSEAFKNRHNC